MSKNSEAITEDKNEEISEELSKLEEKIAELGCRINEYVQFNGCSSKLKTKSSEKLRIFQKIKEQKNKNG